MRFPVPKRRKWSDQYQWVWLYHHASQHQQQEQQESVPETQPPIDELKLQDHKEPSALPAPLALPIQQPSPSSVAARKQSPRPASAAPILSQPHAPPSARPSTAAPVQQHGRREPPLLRSYPAESGPADARLSTEQLLHATRLPTLDAVVWATLCLLSVLFVL